MLRVLLDDGEVDVSAYESYVSDHFNDEFEREWKDLILTMKTHFWD